MTAGEISKAFVHCESKNKPAILTKAQALDTLADPSAESEP